MDDDRYSLALIEALSRVWSRIRFLHPEVPPVVLLAAPSPRGDLSVLGHFGALRWKGKKQDDAHLHEVVVVAEHLNRPAAEIVETLLHEAAHALNFERQIHDCSRSQYHNQRFKAAAEELGLDVVQVRHYGFSLTTLPDTTTARYQDELLYLERVLIHRRRPPTPQGPGLPGPAPPAGGAGDDDPSGGATGDDPPPGRLRKAVCACGFIIRVSRKTLTDTTIRCESCGKAFRLA